MMTAIVLAAGLSNRMGTKNKLLLPYRGKPMLGHTLENLLLTTVENIVVVVGFEHAEVEKTIPIHPKIKIIYNPEYASGQVASVQRGVLALSEYSTGFMICLSDMPFLQQSDYQDLIFTFYDKITSLHYPIIIPHDGSRPGNPAIFHTYFRDAFLRFAQAGKEVIQQNSQYLYKMTTTNPNYFIDIDTPEEYQKYCKKDS